MTYVIYHDDIVFNEYLIDGLDLQKYEKQDMFSIYVEKVESYFASKLENWFSI